MEGFLVPQKIFNPVKRRKTYLYDKYTKRYTKKTLRKSKKDQEIQINWKK